MHEILSDLSVPSLRKATKNNLCEFFRFLGRSPATRFTESPALIRWQTPIPHPWFNGILSRASTDEIGSYAQVVAESIRYFQSQGVDSFTWWMKPEVPVSAWSDFLTGGGFHYTESPPGMAIKLEGLSQQQPQNTGFMIIPVETDSEFREWISTFVCGYGLPDIFESRLYECFHGLGLELPLRHYTGYLNGNPVATASLFLGSGVAGVYNVSTLPEARHKGIGGAVTLAPLIDAQALGYHAGVLQSSDMGYSLYQKLGFKELVKMDHFYWTAGASPDEQS